MAALTDAETEAEMAQVEIQLKHAQDNADDVAMAEAENHFHSLILFGDLANQDLEAIRRARAELENFVKRERESWTSTWCRLVM